MSFGSTSNGRGLDCLGHLHVSYSREGADGMWQQWYGCGEREAVAGCCCSFLRGNLCSGEVTMRADHADSKLHRCHSGKTRRCCRRKRYDSVGGA